MRSSLRTVALGLGVLGTSFAWSLPSSADTISIGLSADGGTITTVATGTGDASTPTGGSSITGASSETFTVNASGSGTTNPVSLLSNELTVNATGAGALQVYVTEQGLTTPLPPGFLSSFTSNLVPSGWSVTEATYLYDCGGASCLTSYVTSGPGATELAATPSITSAGLVTYSFETGAPTVTGPAYELTELFTITASDAASNSTNLTVDVTATPLPSTWTMLIASLLGLGLFAYRGSKKRSSGVSMLDASAVA